MGVPLPSPALRPWPAGRPEIPIKEWPCLDGAVLTAVLLRSRSSEVCMTCHCFRHHASANGIAVLTCELHQGLIAYGGHLVSRCQG